MKHDILFKGKKWKRTKRIKSFLWLVAKNSLHTNKFCHCRHVAPSPICTRCNEDLHESILHALRGCAILGNFWPKLVKRIDYPDFFNANLRQWMLANLQATWLVNGHE